MIQNPTANVADTVMQVRSLGWEDTLEEGMATHSNILAWRIPGTEEPSRLQSMGLQRVRHDWSNFACSMHPGIRNKVVFSPSPLFL